MSPDCSPACQQDRHGHCGGCVCGCHVFARLGMQPRVERLTNDKTPPASHKGRRGGCSFGLVGLTPEHADPVMPVTFDSSLSHAAHVLSGGDRLQMLGVATRAVEAEMVDL